MALQVRTKMTEKGKQGKKHEKGKVKGKHTDICSYLYAHPPTDTQVYINTDTHILFKSDSAFWDYA